MKKKKKGAIGMTHKDLNLKFSLHFLLRLK